MMREILWMFFTKWTLHGSNEKTQGAAVADFDNDGDLDLLLGNSNQPIRLFENLADEYEDRNWITFDLVGTESNKQAIGARITLWVDDNQFQVQQKFGCSGSFGCSDDRMHFGLGSTNEIDSVVVDGLVVLKAPILK